MKQRYSDFVVREVSQDGEVIVLSSIDGSQLESKYFTQNNHSNPCSMEQITAFLDVLKSKGWLPADSTCNLLDYLTRCLTEDDSVPDELVTFSISSKDDRGSVHQLIKSHLSAIVVADTVSVDSKPSIRFRAKFKLKGGTERLNRVRWPPGKDFLRFTLLKENVVIHSAIALQILSTLGYDDSRYTPPKDSSIKAGGD